MVVSRCLMQTGRVDALDQDGILSDCIMRLQLEVSANNQEKGEHWAKDYEL